MESASKPSCVSRARTLRRTATLIHPGEKYEEAHDVGWQKRLDSVAAASVGGVTHAAMIFEQSVRTPFGERLEFANSTGQQATSLRDGPLSHVGRRIGEWRRLQKSQRICS